jgi:hypothetical protein
MAFGPSASRAGKEETQRGAFAAGCRPVTRNRPSSGDPETLKTMGNVKEAIVINNMGFG